MIYSHLQEIVDRVEIIVTVGFWIMDNSVDRNQNREYGNRRGDQMNHRRPYGGNQRNGRYNNRNRQQEPDWNHDAFEKANTALDEEREAYREKLRNEVARRLKEQRQ